MTLAFPLLIFGFQILLALSRGLFDELSGGIFLNGVFLFFFYSAALLLRCGKREKFQLQQNKVSRKELLRFFFFVLLCVAIFIDALRVMPNLDAIRLDQVAIARGELLEENNYWQPRILGYLSVLITILTVHRASSGLKYNLFALASILISLMNSVLTFGRGYLLLNLFALLSLYSGGRSKKAALPFFAFGFFAFIGVEFARHGDNGLEALLETFSSYFLAPIVGSNFVFQNGVNISLNCQSALLSVLTSGCTGNLSQTIAQTEFSGFSSNVYGVVGEWYAIGGLLLMPLIGVAYGIAMKKNTTKIPQSFSESVAYYLFSVFSIYHFFSDPFLTNGVFAGLLMFVILSSLRRSLARKSRKMRVGV